MVAERHRRGRVVTVERGQRATVPQDAIGLGKRALGLGHMAQRRVEEDRVEHLVREPERPRVGLLEADVGHIGGQLAGLVQERSGQVDPDHGPVLRPAGEQTRENPCPAPHLQQLRLRSRNSTSASHSCRICRCLGSAPRVSSTSARRSCVELSSSATIAQASVISNLLGSGGNLTALAGGARRPPAADAVRRGAALAPAAGGDRRRRPGRRIRGCLGERPFRLPDALARRADGAREHDRTLGGDGAGNDGLARRPSRPGCVGQGAGRDRRPLRGATGRRRWARAPPNATTRFSASRSRSAGSDSTRRSPCCERCSGGSRCPSSRATTPFRPTSSSRPVHAGRMASRSGSEAGVRRAGLARVARAGDGWLASAYNTTPEGFSDARAALGARSRSAGGNRTAFPTRSRRCGPGYRRIERRAIACSPTSWLRS